MIMMKRIKVCSEQEQQNRVLFDAKKFVISELLDASKGKPYVIPSFQRPYCWSNEQIEQLVRDLMEFYDLQKGKNGLSEYSLGTIVCEHKDSCFSILDGQQRLTTLDLFLDYISRNLSSKRKERERIIACYQYLPNGEGRLRSSLPFHVSLDETFLDVLKTHFQVKKEEIPFAEIDACIRQKVYVIRVTLPLSGRNDGEAEKMFEIINVSGERLSLIDQIKARLLSYIPEDRKNERIIISRFWEALPELLRHPARAAEGFDFDLDVLAPNDELLKEERLCEIIERSLKKDVSQTTRAREEEGYSRKKTKEEKTEEEEVDGVTVPEEIVADPPIDEGNLLVVASELLRFSFEKDFLNKSRGSTGDSVLKLSYSKFDWLTNEIYSDSVPMSLTEKILRLIGITNLILQIVGRWGVYRQQGKVLDETKFTPMLALELSFMAENRFHNDAQYWFLMLAANALCGPSSDELTLRERSTAVDRFYKNWTLSQEKLEKLQPSVFKRLVGWAIHRACTSETGTDAAMRWALMSDQEFQGKFKEQVQSLSEAVKSWKYDDGLRHWQLYFLDWLLWSDYQYGQNDFRRILKTYKTENSSVKEAIRKFKWVKFKRILRTFRIVRHGAIEHWCAQKMAGEDKELLDKLNGFGNLALIDTSLNSTLRDLSVSDKGEYVRKNDANYSLKLGWLAVFTDACPEYGVNDVEDLTDFWGAYMSRYPYEELAKNP